MQFDIITIFPKAFDSYLNESMLKRARAKKIADIKIHNLRDFSTDKHRKVDDRPYGGGPGMVLKIEPLAKAVDSILKRKAKSPACRLPAGKAGTGMEKRKNKVKVILFSAGGKQFSAKTASDWAKKHDQIIMVCGHYEGIDERIKKIYKMEEISVGPYVLTGGELPAMVVIDAVMRHIPGFLGKAESLEEKRYGPGLPAFTRPEVFVWKGKKYKVPMVLLSGHHKNIDEWRKK